MHGSFAINIVPPVLLPVNTKSEHTPGSATLIDAVQVASVPSVIVRLKSPIPAEPGAVEKVVVVL